ncbi:flagellar biosynthetic protein FliO [Blastococcus sp. TF02A-35]|uniref:flagellar biosynthetic protein FliO n=1 Tax=Blastococcus sp. TF02A-35 TaxID=2559612 RepID=UPI00107373E1|nr:flagellar biosynthetic protein FliO [Blastococcus sp. TF02A_35]TFV52947.1 flagellar biosynthetic protein FliO [Blastococcus sp. TF02A_35]
MTWMVIRLVLTLALIAGVLWYAAKYAKKRGIGQGNGLIEVVARQRMGRTSSVNVVRIADVVLVIGATEEQVTLLAEVDGDAVDAALGERRPARVRDEEEHDDVEDTRALAPARVARSSEGVLAGSVLDRNGWGSLVDDLRERTVRRS